MDMRIFLYIFVIAFLVYEIGREIIFLVKHKNCKRSVMATVVSLRESSRGKYGSKFKATVRYDIGARSYSEELHHSYRYDELSVGEQVNILIDEEDPTVMLEQRERGSAAMKICCSLLFAFFMILIVWASSL